MKQKSKKHCQKIPLTKLVDTNQTKTENNNNKNKEWKEKEKEKEKANIFDEQRYKNLVRHLQIEFMNTLKRLFTMIKMVSF